MRVAPDAVTRAVVLSIKSIIAFCLLSTAGVPSAQADPAGDQGLPEGVPDPPALWQRSAAGVLLGPWFAGDFGKDVTAVGNKFKGDETGFHIEFFYKPHLTGIIYADINVGAIGRGQLHVTKYPGTDTLVEYLGDVTLYPIGVGIMIAPLAKNTGMRLQPMIRAGGSLLVLTQRGESRRYDDDRYWIDTDTDAELGYYAGAGLSWILSHQIMLLGGVKYQHAEFDIESPAGGNYSGVQVLFGVAYLYR